MEHKTKKKNKMGFRFHIPCFRHYESEDGISVVEILVALAIFVFGVASIALIYINSVTGAYSNLDKTGAVFLAQEGLEAVKSIRDNDFDALTIGTHGLELSGGKWTLFGDSDQISVFTRTVAIETDSHNGFIVKSKIVWQDHFLDKEREVELTESISNIWGD